MPEDILVRLGIHLKKARESRDMTQQRLSDVSGIAVRTISKIERGQMNPSFELLSILIPFLEPV
jgi:transcriptional regulator with XRE-family HTH domain